MRILIAEDERVTRVSLARQLESWDHCVTSVEDGQAAWDAFGAAEFDLVITDWEMPRLSGIELIQRIRQRSDGHYVYIVLLTGRTNKADIVGGIEAGADDFITKPFDREELRVRVLAGARVVRLERTLYAQNLELRAASDRIHHDLRSAARVQRAMLPRQAINTPHINSAWTFVPTDELAGDAIGLELLQDRYLVAYVIDVSGHGVPAALLSVTTMHALAPSGEGASLLLGAEDGQGIGPLQPPARAVAELNRRFCASDNDGRFLTMVLFVLDSHTGRGAFARAGHPLPILLRGGGVLPLSDEGGFPLAVTASADYADVPLQFEPGDRIVLYSDGFQEQARPCDGQQYGDERLRKLMIGLTAAPGPELVSRSVDALGEWAGEKRFTDDMSLVVIEWTGPSQTGQSRASASEPRLSPAQGG
jgi:sigma-B regulation protein RsbU (phosphoserine phosphatase)